jgi:Uncharacterised nucleotidyltransferase
MESLLWDRVGELADQAPRISDLRYHKLELVAASRMRARGDSVPDELRQCERFAAVIGLSAAPLMRRVQAATDASMIVMKGPEAAARWPSPRLRPWKDLDLLVEDAEGVQAALLAAGFVEVDEPEKYRELHHLCPLALPGVPMTIEVHRRPHWPNHEAPSFHELAEAATPSTLGVPGVLAPSPAHHAVLIAGHAWAHDSLSRVAFLADVASMLLAADPEDVAAAARAWSVSRAWSTTSRAVERLLLEPGRPARPPIWLRHLHETRERTVFEGHVERVLGPVAAGPVTAAPAAAARALLRTLWPTPGESWGEKLHRSRRAMHHASVRKSEHDDELSGRTAT